MRKPILVAGIPRSGSTWLAKTLSISSNAKYIHEPDNEKKNLVAFIAKNHIHRYPYLKKSDKNDLYYKLWESAFKGINFHNKISRRFRTNNQFVEKQIGYKCDLIHTEFFKDIEDKNFVEDKLIDLKKWIAFKLINIPFIKFMKYRKIIVKSVHLVLALDWIYNNFDIDIVIIVRHPANVISSYLNLKMGDSIRNIFVQKDLVDDYFSFCFDDINKAKTIIEKMAVQIGAFYHIIEEQLKKYPEWIIVKHEDLCMDPFQKFKDICNQLNIKWSTSAKNYIETHNRPGNGFKISRIANEQIDKYKKILSTDEIERIRKCYRIFNNNLYNDF